MKKIIITFLAGIIYLTNLGAQSYLYDKGSSGASLGVSRLNSQFILSIDMSYKGRLGVGATAYRISEYDHIVGIHATYNLVKVQTEDNVLSFPITFGYFNKGLRAIGAGLYNKNKVTKDFSIAIGLNYSRLFSSKSSNFNYTKSGTNNLGFDLVLFYKDFKVGQTISWSKNTNLSVGVTVGIAFGHKSNFSEDEEEYIEPEDEP